MGIGSQPLNAVLGFGVLMLTTENCRLISFVDGFLVREVLFCFEDSLKILLVLASKLYIDEVHGQ